MSSKLNNYFYNAEAEDFDNNKNTNNEGRNKMSSKLNNYFYAAEAEDLDNNKNTNNEGRNKTSSKLNNYFYAAEAEDFDNNKNTNNEWFKEAGDLSEQTNGNEWFKEAGDLSDKTTMIVLREKLMQMVEQGYNINKIQEKDGKFIVEVENLNENKENFSGRRSR